MTTADPIARAERLHALHDRNRVLLLPNAWDAGSARLFAGLGAPAVATTSGGVAWSLGFADGESTPLDEVLAATRRMARAISVPLTVDFEAGFGATPSAVHDSVRAVIRAGAAGINIEDGIGHRLLRPLEGAAARITAAREAAVAEGVPIFINARVDSWAVGGDEDDKARLAGAIRRAHAYLDAGADGIYPIGLYDPALLERLCAAVDAPINVTARTGLADLATLARLGVARVSMATRLSTLAYSAARAAMEAVQRSGRFEDLDAAFGYPQMQALFDED